MDTDYRALRGLLLFLQNTLRSYKTFRALLEVERPTAHSFSGPRIMEEGGDTFLVPSSAPAPSQEAVLQRRQARSFQSLRSQLAQQDQLLETAQAQLAAVNAKSEEVLRTLTVSAASTNRNRLNVVTRQDEEDLRDAFSKTLYGVLQALKEYEAGAKRKRLSRNSDGHRADGTDSDSSSDEDDQAAASITAAPSVAVSYRDALARTTTATFRVHDSYSFAELRLDAVKYFGLQHASMHLDLIISVPQRLRRLGIADQRLDPSQLVTQEMRNGKLPMNAEDSKVGVELIEVTRTLKAALQEDDEITKKKNNDLSEVRTSYPPRHPSPFRPTPPPCRPRPRSLLVLATRLVPIALTSHARLRPDT